MTDNYTKTLILNEKTGKQVEPHQWINRKGRYGNLIRFEILNLYPESEEARVRYLTEGDGYLYTTQTFHKLGLKKVLI